MKIDISRLNKTRGGSDFSYNDKAEIAITNALCYYHELESKGGTDGYDPGYDKLINNSKVEIKVSSHAQLYIEVAKANGDPSGMMTSMADVYLTVNPGTDRGLRCMKVRLYRKRDLDHWCRQMMCSSSTVLRKFPANDMGPGSQGFVLDWDAAPDLYCLGFRFAQGMNAPHKIVFDTHHIIEPSPFAINNLDKWLK